MTDNADEHIVHSYVIVFFLCGAYKCFRGLSRIMNLVVRNSILSLAMSPIVHLHHAIVSVIIFTWTGIHWNRDPAHVTNTQTEVFRCLSAIVCGILGIELLIVFTYSSLKFAMTSNGIGHVLKRIAYSLFVLLFVILIFSLMFSSVYSSTNICEDPEDFLFCRFGTSMLELYGYLFGNVEYSYFYVSSSGVLLEPRREGNFAVCL